MLYRDLFSGKNVLTLYQPTRVNLTPTVVLVVRIAPLMTLRLCPFIHHYYAVNYQGIATAVMVVTTVCKAVHEVEEVPVIEMSCTSS